MMFLLCRQGIKILLATGGFKGELKRAKKGKIDD